MTDALFNSLFAAIQAAPDNLELRVQVAQLLLERDRPADAIEHASRAIQLDPANTAAIEVLIGATSALRSATPAAPLNGEHAQRTASAPTDTASAAETTATTPAARAAVNPVRATPTSTPAAPADPTQAAPAPASPAPANPAPATSTPAFPESADTDNTGTAHSTDNTDNADSTANTANTDHEFDWSKAEQDLGDAAVPPPFIANGARSAADSAAESAIVPGGDDVEAVIEEFTERVTLADVGGLEPVKQRIRESFLEPMRHPELAKAFGKSLRGGLVLYGPPGCGKTYMARAIAGELGARFLTTSLADILGSHFGETEKNLRALFTKARSLTPAVLFLDEIDAIGARRSSIGSGWSGMRAMVDQLLMELDSMTADNDGLFVLAATNSPWDVDSALLRPGRLDRMLLVLPPDEAAREAILRMHLERRPIAGIDLRSIVKRTDGFSGADLEHVVSSAAEQAMLKSIASGQVQPIGMAEIDHVLREVKPSTGAWLASAKNVATFANTDGRYDDLVAYLKSRRIL